MAYFGEEKHQQRLFVTTHWSVVLAAQDKLSPDSSAALDELCRCYWYPLYAYIRGCGNAPEDAQDLTQEFFARLLAKDWLRVVSPERGRFRTFLLVAAKRFLANEFHRATRQKRGAGISAIPIDAVTAEHRFAAEPPLTPDELYERRWAMTLLEQTMEQISAEFGQANKAHDFAVMKEWLAAAQGEIPYAVVARQLKTTEGAARVAVHRLRKRFRELFREKIAQTVAGPEEVETELRHVASVLSRA